MKNTFKIISYILSSIFLLLVIFSLIAIALYYLYQLPPGKTSAEGFKNIIFCHRANVYHAPENTLLAIIEAKKAGCAAIEIDVVGTKDNHLILFHDDTLDQLTTLHGYVWDYTWSQLRKTKIIFHGKPTANIPSLLDAVMLAKKLNLKIELDLKLSGDVNKYAQELAQIYHKTNIYNSALASSFYPNLLYKLRSLDSRILISLEVFRRPFPEHPFMSQFTYWSEMTWLPHFLHVNLIEPNFRLVSLIFVQRWLTYGIYTNTFTVNASADKAWLDHHHISYQTDCFQGGCANRSYYPWDGSEKEP